MRTFESVLYRGSNIRVKSNRPVPGPVVRIEIGRFFAVNEVAFFIRPFIFSYRLRLGFRLGVRRRRELRRGIYRGGRLRPPVRPHPFSVSVPAVIRPVRSPGRPADVHSD